MFKPVRKFITSFFSPRGEPTSSPSTTRNQYRLKWIDRMCEIAIQFLDTNHVRPFVNQFFFEYRPDERIIIFFATRDESGTQFRPEDLLGNFIDDDWTTCSRMIIEHLTVLRTSTELRHKRFNQRIVIATSSAEVPNTSTPMRIRWCLRSSVAPSTITSSYMGPVLDFSPDSRAVTKK